MMISSAPGYRLSRGTSLSTTNASSAANSGSVSSKACTWDGLRYSIALVVQKTEDGRQRGQRQQCANRPGRQLTDHKAVGRSRHQQVQAAEEQQLTSEVQPTGHAHPLHGYRKRPIAAARHGRERNALEREALLQIGAKDHRDSGDRQGGTHSGVRGDRILRIMRPSTIEEMEALAISITTTPAAA